MKVAPLFQYLKRHKESMQPYLVHTGQHYDKAMKAAFFDQLNIPEPDIDLEVGSGSHAVQTAEIMLRFEPILDQVKPFAVLVVGDVNSTIACGLVAVKKNIPIIHVEAGLRSYDRGMPEEINRVLTDQLSDLLFTTERSALQNLEKEGIVLDKVHFVGNVMIDSLHNHLNQAISFKDILESHKVEQREALREKQFALLTLHRPSNVDNPEILKGLLETFKTISHDLPIVFPVHPRTGKMIKEYGLSGFLELPNIFCLPPVGYLEILGLMNSAKLILTDSGGIQEETTALGIPCITLRENTERPITVDQGTNTIVGSARQKIVDCVDEVLKTGGKSGRIPEYWDGCASERIISIIQERFL